MIHHIWWKSSAVSVSHQNQHLILPYTPHLRIRVRGGGGGKGGKEARDFVLFLNLNCNSYTDASFKHIFKKLCLIVFVILMSVLFSNSFAFFLLFILCLYSILDHNNVYKYGFLLITISILIFAYTFFISFLSLSLCLLSIIDVDSSPTKVHQKQNKSQTKANQKPTEAYQKPTKKGLPKPIKSQAKAHPKPTINSQKPTKN